jgi:hypothetical protein
MPRPSMSVRSSSARSSSPSPLVVAARRIATVLGLGEGSRRVECRATLGLAALVPWAWLALVVAVVVRARVAASVWSPGAGSSSFASFSPGGLLLGESFDWLLMYAMPPAVLLVVLFSLASTTVLSRRDSRGPTLALVASAAAVVALLAFDPLGLMRL